MLEAEIFDNRVCELGEGPFWHPVLKQLFWFDILGKRLLSRKGERALEWTFTEHHSAAGWIDETTLLLASETGLWRFDIQRGVRNLIIPLEADNPKTRSNDGRADPFGGFWIGTMGKMAEHAKGAIYRYFRGELRKVVAGVTIPNSICFSVQGCTAFYADTAIGRIMQQPLDSEGWPKGDPEIFVDLAPDGIHPDGSVVDAEGGLWNAQWGQGRVVRYLPDGREDQIVSVGGKHSSCPAFGGPDMTKLFITTACEGIVSPDEQQGKVYSVQVAYKGQPEQRVLIQT